MYGHIPVLYIDIRMFGILMGYPLGFKLKEEFFVLLFRVCLIVDVNFLIVLSAGNWVEKGLRWRVYSQSGETICFVEKISVFFASQTKSNRKRGFVKNNWT
jgi:hypothetical protein